MQEQRTYSLKELSEPELLALAQEGHEGAFTALVRLYQGTVLNFALKVCRDRSKAEETLQDTFINVFQKISQFDGRSRFSTWLYSIVTNNCLMKGRRRKIDDLMEVYDEFPVETPTREKRPPLPADWDTPSVGLLQDELKETMDRAILKLPIEYRLVFILRDLEEKSGEEVATILNLSVEAVKSRLRRARAFLRKELSAYVTS